jgi:hypothetical protein
MVKFKVTWDDETGFFSKKPSELVVKFGSDESSDVKEIYMHPNFYKTMETLQDNIVSIWENMKEGSFEKN